MLFLLFVLLFFTSLVLISVTEVRFRKQLREQEREISAFIGVISHQLHTQLTSVKWYTEMLAQKEFGPLKVSQMEAIDKIAAGHKNADKILDRLLEISRLDRCDIIISPTTIALQEHIDHIMNMHQDDAKQKKITLSTPKSTEYVLAYVDPIILHSVLDILLTNAIMYTKEKGKVTVSYEEKRNDVVIAIQDTGVGIASNEKRHVFSKFFRGKQAFLMHPNGNGLGLYLAKRLISRLDSSIWFSSKDGEGSTFYFSIPKATTDK